MPTRRLALYTFAALAAGAALSAAPWRAQRPPADDTFASRIAAVSEPGGFFDTDNLISNERSYLHVVSGLAERGVRGGAYIGVGPDQNFSYIVAVRPSIAILVDIRRDNLLLHLLFKALFSLSRTRVEYLALLTGRAPPEPLAPWQGRSIEAIVAHLDRSPVPAAAPIAALQARVARTIRTFGVPLSDGDLQTIARFHRAFIDAGLGLQFTSTGRAPQHGYPTLRDLLLEVDRAGVHRNYLAAEDDFAFLKSLQARDLVIPAVGDLSGDTALPAIARFLHARREPVSAFYASNVEFYLFRNGRFPSFVANLQRLPVAPNGVIIRSVFGGGLTPPHPGYNSVSLLQPIRALLEGYARGQFRQYRDLTREGLAR